MVDVHQNLNGSRDLTKPLSGMTNHHQPSMTGMTNHPFQGWFANRGLALAIVSLPTKFEVYLHSLQTYERRYEMSKWGGLN